MNINYEDEVFMRVRLYNDDDYDRCCELLVDSKMEYSFSEKSDAKLFEDVVASESFCEECTFVLEDDDAICGIVVFTRCRVGKFDGLLLSIFFVDEEHSNDDNVDLLVGSAVDVLVSRGVKFVCVMGEPGVFARFGFTRARDFGILCPFYIEDDYFMAICEDGFKTRGELCYAKEFFE